MVGFLLIVTSININYQNYNFIVIPIDTNNR